jgi:hypothetical protein
MSNRVKIFVVAHKPFEMLDGEVLTPIHVGRAEYVRGKTAEGGIGLNPDDPMAGMIGDDTGENISLKNPQYCEMTAHYWIWKNVHDTKYVGVCHYRRYFSIDISEDNIEQSMNDTDIIMVEPSWHTDSVYAYFAKFMGAENMTILWMVMKILYPEYAETLELVCDGVKFYPFNMLLCKKELFDEYCEWLFSVLGECEKYVMPSPYTNGRRALAYMAELLTGVYFIHQGLRIKTVPYYKIEDGQGILVERSEEERMALEKYEHTLLRELAWKIKEDRKEKFENPAILLGLKNDGILGRTDINRF